MEEKSIAFYIGAVSIIDVMLPSPLIRLCDVDMLDYVNDRFIQCRFLFHLLFSGFHFRNVERKWTQVPVFSPWIPNTRLQLSPRTNLGNA